MSNIIFADSFTKNNIKDGIDNLENQIELLNETDRKLYLSPLVKSQESYALSSKSYWIGSEGESSYEKSWLCRLFSGLKVVGILGIIIGIPACIYSGYYAWILNSSVIFTPLSFLGSWFCNKYAKKAILTHENCKNVRNILYDLKSNCDELLLQYKIKEHFAGYDYEGLDITIDRYHQTITISCERQKNQSQASTNEVTVITRNEDAEDITIKNLSKESFDILTQDNNLNFVKFYEYILSKTPTSSNESTHNAIPEREKRFHAILDMLNNF